MLFAGPGMRTGWAAFGELGFEGFLGRSHYDTFSGLSTAAQGYGEQTLKSNWASSLRLGISMPLGTMPGSSGVAMLDAYAGLVMTNATHTIQGSDGTPAQQANGYFGQVNRTTVDPTIGAGVRPPLV